MSLFIFPIAFGAVHLWGFSLGLWFLCGAFSVWWFGGGLRENIPYTALDPWIALYTLFFVVSAAFSKIPYFSMVEAFKLAGVLAAFWVTRYLCVSRPQTYRLAECFALMGGLLSAIGLLQRLGGLDRDWWARPDLVASMYVNHNHFAGLLVLLLPMSAGLAIAERSRSKKVLFIFLCILMGIAFLFAFSRGAFVALAAAFFVMILLLMKRRLLSKAWLPLVVICALVVGGAAIFGTGAIEQRLQDIRLMDEREELSLRFRWLTWLGTLPMIARYFWLGSGPGTFEHLFLTFRPSELFAMRPVYAHNDFLQLAAECGVFAFAATAALTLVFFKNGVRIVLRDESRLRGGVGAGVLAGLTGFLVHALFDFNFHIPANWLLSAVAAGMLTSMDEERTYASRTGASWIRAGISVLLPAILTGCFYLGLSDYYFRRAKHDFEKGRVNEALPKVQKSLDIDPFSGETYYLRGLARPEKEVEASIADFDQAIRLNPYEPVYDLAKARALAPQLSERWPEGLVKILETAISKDPKNPRLAFLAARLTFGRNRALRDEAGDMLSQTPERLTGLVDYLEKSDLWQFHRIYHLKQLGVDPDALKKDSPQDVWTRPPYASFSLKDFSQKPPASGEDGLLFQNTVITNKINIHKSLVRLVLKAKGSAAKGVYPTLYVKIDGKLLDEYYVDYASQKNYYTDLRLEPGEHELSLEYVNDLKVGASASEDRNVWIQNVQLLEA